MKILESWSLQELQDYWLTDWLIIYSLTDQFRHKPKKDKDNETDNEM